MATARLIPGSYTLSNTNYLQCNNNNMLANTSNTSYSTITHNRNSNTAYYLYLHNFNFSAIPDNAVVSSFTVKIKAYESGLSSSSSYYMSLYNGTSAISNTTVSGALTTSAQTFTFPNGSLTWSTLKGYGNNFRIRVPLRRASSSTKGYAYVYGAEIEVNYTAETVHVTGVSLDHNTATIGEGDTYQLTETVLPANATDKSVSWSSSNTSVATVDANGLVTAVSPGSATITVTTTDGGYTATCAVTVTAATYVDYVLTDHIEAGKEYIIASGNSGTVRVLTNVSGGSAILNGIAATVSGSKISITTGNAAKAAFTCELETSGDSSTTLLKDGDNNYLYTDSSNHLRVAAWTSSMAGKHWHYKAESKHLLWFFKDGTDNDGYTDTSGTYKYYLEVNGSGNFTDNHVTSPSLADTTTPAMYVYVKDTGQTEQLSMKVNGAWTSVSKVYQKQNGSWVEIPSSSWSTLFSTSANYRKMN